MVAEPDDDEMLIPTEDGFNPVPCANCCCWDRVNGSEGTEDAGDDDEEDGTNFSFQEDSPDAASELVRASTSNFLEPAAEAADVTDTEPEGGDDIDDSEEEAFCELPNARRCCCSNDERDCTYG